MAKVLENELNRLAVSPIIELYDLDLSALGYTRIFYFCNHKNIIFKRNRYDFVPIAADGFEQNPSAGQVKPRLRLANGGNQISAIIAIFGDLAGCKIIRHRIMEKHLYLDNPPELAPEIWYLERKTSENEFMVEYELASPLHFNSQKLPARLITRKCLWEYRGFDCGYTGSLMYTDRNQPTGDPKFDKCAKTVQACELRFGNGNPLPYGGFSSVD